MKREGECTGKRECVKEGTIRGIGGERECVREGIVGVELFLTLKYYW
jgi:hypothetical protein